MTQELLYTSAPRGLKPGSRGYCTVVSTQSMSAPLAQVLESLSGYRHIAPPGDPANPVAFSHVLLSAGGRKYRVVSRVCDSGLDYSGRSNKLAHHVALEPGELPAGGPAWLMQQPRFLLESWDGKPQLLPVGRSSLEGDAVQARCTTWQDMTGDAGWAGVLAEAFLEDANRQVFIVFEPGMELLTLLAEAISLLPPDRRWEVTFSTFATSIPAGVECHWRCVLAGSPEANQSRRHVRALRIDLTEQLPQAVGGPLVEVARTGKRPVEQETRAAVPPVPVPPVGQAGSRRAGTYRLGDAEERYSRKAPADGSPPPLRPNGRRWGFNPLLAGAIMLLMLTGLIAGTVWKSRGQTATAKPEKTATERKQDKQPKTVALAANTKKNVPQEDDAIRTRRTAATDAQNDPLEPVPPSGPQPAPGGDGDIRKKPNGPADRKKPKPDQLAEPGTTPNNPTAAEVVYVKLPDFQEEGGKPLVYLDLDPGEAGFKGWEAELLVPDATRGIWIESLNVEDDLSLIIKAQIGIEKKRLAKLTIRPDPETEHSYTVRFQWLHELAHDQLRSCAMRLTAPDHQRQTIVFREVLRRTPVQFNQFTARISIDGISENSNPLLTDIALLRGDTKDGTQFTTVFQPPQPTGHVALEKNLPDGIREVRAWASAPDNNGILTLHLHARYSLAVVPDFSGTEVKEASVARTLDKFKEVHENIMVQWNNIYPRILEEAGSAPVKPRGKTETRMSPREALEKLQEKSRSSEKKMDAIESLITQVEGIITLLSAAKEALDFLDSLATAHVTHATIAVPLYTVEDAKARKSDKREAPFYSDLIRIRPEEASKETGPQAADKRPVDDDKSAGGTKGRPEMN